MIRILNKYALKILSGLCFGFLIMSLYACIGSEVIELPPRRTILFYIGSDTNGLDNGRAGDEPLDMINAIRAGWIPGRGEMLIYTDQTNRHPCLMRIKDTRAADGLYALDTVYVYSEENSADAAVLNRVIKTVVNDYPADSYGMIFFSHASGWLPQGMLAAPRSSDADRQNMDNRDTANLPVQGKLFAELNQDETDLRSLVIDRGEGVLFEMEYDDFAAAIPDGQFDFIIFEACFIADVILMYELRNKTEYVLASSAEIVSPGFTPVYKNNIMRLYDTRNPVASVVAGFAQSYIDHIKKSYPEDDVLCSAILGLVKTSEMQNLATTVKATLDGIMLDESTLTVDNIQRFDRPKYNRLNLITSGQRRIRYSDFGHTMEHLASDKLISGAHYAAFQTQMAKTIVWKANTKRFLLGNYTNGEPYFAEYDGFFIEHHSGLSTYIEQDVYPVINAAYKNSSWYKAIY